MRTIIVTGLSGSGKSVVLKVLEDAGYYCVDNLPVMFALEVILFLQKMGNDKVALSLDVRSGSGIGDLPRTIDQLKTNHVDPRVLFLEANTETIVKRFSEARRPHPLARRQEVALIQADVHGDAIPKTEVPIDLADELDAELRHPDVLRCRELLPDRTRRQGRRRAGVRRVAFDDGDRALERWVGFQEVGDRAADGTAPDDRDVVYRA